MNQLKKIFVNNDSSLVTVSAGNPISDPQAKWEYGTSEDLINQKFAVKDAEIDEKIDEQDELISGYDQRINLLQNDMIELSDKAYDASTYSGLGRKLLKKNMVNGVNTLTQDMMPLDTGQNTIYVIQYDYVLGENITVPANCVLDFEGGSITDPTGINRRLSLNGTFLAKYPKLDVILNGTCKNDYLNNTWYGIIPVGDPSETNTNYDINWYKLLYSARNLKTPAMVVSGYYSTFSTIELQGYTGIVGADTIPTIIYKGDANSSMFYLRNNYNSIKNLILVRHQTEQTVKQATGVKLGLHDESLPQNGYVSSYSNLEHVYIYYFNIGLDVSRAWYNNLVDIKTNHNIIGVKSGRTETHIYNLHSDNNVVGFIQEDKHGNASIICGSIEGNGIGILMRAGQAYFEGLYMEANYPSDDNQALDYHYNDNFRNGASIVCGDGEDTVKTFAIAGSIVYHYKEKRGNLCYFDKCYNISIINTFLGYIESTKNSKFLTSTSNSAEPDNIPFGAHFINQSSFPILTCTEFYADHLDTITGAQRYIFGGGLGITYKNISVPSYENIRFAFTRPEDDGGPDSHSYEEIIERRNHPELPQYEFVGEDLRIDFGGNYVKKGIYTIVVACTFTLSVDALKITDNININGKEYDYRYNQNGIIKIPVEVNVSSDGGTGFAVISIHYNPTNYRKDTGGNVYGVWIYVGTPYNMNISTVSNTQQMLNAAVQEAERLLVIPAEAPSDRAYDARCFSSKAKLYFDSTTHMLKISYNGIVYNADGTTT